MKESTKKQLLGNKFYPVYRRMRFLRYKGKIKRHKEKEIKRSQQTDQLEEKKAVKIKKESRSFGQSVYRIYRIIRFLNRKRKTNRELKKVSRIEIQKEKKAENLVVKERLKVKQQQDKQFDKAIILDKKLSKKEKKYRRRRLIKYIAKKQFRYFINDIKHFDINTLKKWFRWFGAIAENKERRKHFLIIAGNSVVLFLLSYLLIYAIAQIVTMFVALNFDYKVILFYHKIYYAIDATDWTADSVKILFSIPPFTGLVLGIVSIIIYSTFQNEGGLLKLFFLWMFIHGMNMFFGSLLMGTLLNKGFGWVIAYLYYMDTGKMIFSILSIFALIAIGGVVSKSFLISGNSYFNFLNRENRKFLLFSQVLLPVFIGTIILILLKIPNNFYYTTEDEALFETLKLSSVVFVLIPIVMSFRTYHEIYFDEEPKKIRLAWKFFLFTILLVIAFRFGIQEGWYVGG